MKRTGIITGILLILMVSSSGYLSAQRGTRGKMGSAPMGRMRMGNDTIRMHRNSTDTLIMRGMGYGMGRSYAYAPGFDMKNGIGPERMYRGGRGQFGPGRMMMESIPNVTQKQKDEISNLMKKQQEEMKKLQDEMSSKMQTLRDSHRKSILNVYTAEQKKFIESGTLNTTTAPATAK